MVLAFTLLLLVGLVASIAAWIVAVMRERGHLQLCRFEGRLRLPKAEAVVLVAVVAGMVRYGATKDRSGNTYYFDTLRRDAVERKEDNMEGLRTGGSGSYVCFTGIERQTNSVALGVSWGAGAFAVPPFIEFYARTNLVAGMWMPIGWAEADAGVTNLAVEVESWRLPGGMMPKSAFFAAMAFDGLGGDDDDDDGDGVLNGEERAIGTNPRRDDTDGDGFEDGIEAARVSYGAVLPPFDLSSLTNVISGALMYQPSSVSVAVDIPFFVEFAANRSNRAIVHFEGMVAFLGDGASSIPAYATIGDPEDLYATGQAAVAAYGCMFWTMGWGSQLRTGIVQGTQGRWFVAEWRDMMHPNDYVNLTLESSTFLLAVSEAEPGTVYVHYETLSGSIDGSTGIVGAHGFGGVPNLLVADGVQGSVTNGMTIAYHFGTGTDPLNADTDGDDMPDEWEFAHGMNPLVDNRTDGNPRTNADADPDCDGLANAQEAAIGLDPFQPDTDGDGMDDGWEVRHGFDPMVHNGQTERTDDDANADPDGDGLTNAEECAWRTNPDGSDRNGDGIPDGRDTDGDGVNDGAEVAQGSDPAEATDGGLPNSRIMVPFYFGDHSTSHSEKYLLSVSPSAGSGAGMPPRAFSWVNAAYGQCETRMAALKPGWSYEVRLVHAATNREQGPDYDYTLNVMNVPQSVVASDPDGLLGVHSSSDVFTGEGKMAMLSAYKFTVEEIMFDHVPAVCTNDAVSIRRNASLAFDTSHGEWWTGGDGLKNDPVCYAGNVVPVVKARFKVSPALASATLCAETVGTNSPLGRLGAQTVAFVDGESAWTDFSMDAPIARIVRKAEHRWEWKVKQMNGTAVTEFTCATTGPHTVYTLLADPKPPWSTNGVCVTSIWTNALDFCNAFLEGKDNPQETMVAITSNLFHNMGFRYDTVDAAPHYWNTNGTFELTRYMAHDDSRVNCFDQAYGVATLAGIFGIRTQIDEMEPFGYINTTNIVGVGMCNNPVYEMTEEIRYFKDVVDDQGHVVTRLMTNTVLRAQICSADETQRSYFGRHAFVGVYDGRIFDACIGPALGTMFINDYMRSVIDYSTDNERRFSRYWNSNFNYDAISSFDYKLE